MTVFVDASFFIALFNKDDEFHIKAQKIVEDLESSFTRFLTSNIVLAETINLIFRIKGPSIAKEFLQTFQKSNVEEIFLSKDIFEEAYNILFSQESKRGLNLFDCLHLATMRSTTIHVMLSFDKQFKKKVEVIP